MEENPYRSPETRASERPTKYNRKLLDRIFMAAAIIFLIAVVIWVEW